MTTRLAAPLFAVATTFGLLTLSACGGGSSTPASVPADADVVVKAEEGIQWNAKSFTATATDGKVTLFAENESALAHNVYVLDSNDKVQGTFIDLPTKGSSGTRELSLAPGTYRIVCKVPGHNNMNSELVVS